MIHIKPPMIPGTTTFPRCLCSSVKSVCAGQVSPLIPPPLFFSSRALLHRDPHNLANLSSLTKVGTQVYGFGPPSVHIPYALYRRFMGSMHIKGCDQMEGGGAI